MKYDQFLYCNLTSLSLLNTTFFTTSSEEDENVSAVPRKS